jgi:hypothetical protein
VDAILLLGHKVMWSKNQGESVYTLK